jgi:hypothetical protein
MISATRWPRPSHASLHDLPPLLIHVGAAEGLLDDALHLAERARDQHLDVTLQVFPDMIHAFHVFAPLLPVAREAILDIGVFAQRRTGALPALAQAHAIERDVLVPSSRPSRRSARARGRRRTRR